MANILVIDDDESVASALRRFFEFEGHACRVCGSAADGLRAIQDVRPDLVVLDIRMPGVDGLQALEQIQARYPGLSVVMMTGYGTSQTSIDAMRAGAFDYLTKPPDLDDLRAVLARALAASAMRETLPAAELDGLAHVGLVGEAPPMRELYKMIGRLAANDVPALIEGEPGTGKALVVATLHANSARAKQPLRVVDCGGPQGEVERAMFGGGAGTLHLARIEKLPPELQSRLARALAGEAGPRLSADTLASRVLATTEHDLGAGVTAGTFNRDLFQALSLITLRLPPLRERREDIPLLVRHFLQRINARLNRSFRGVDDQAARRLKEHAWPGNVGELERVLTRAAIVAGGDIITAADIGDLDRAAFTVGTEAASALERATRTALQERLVEAKPDSSSIFHDLVDIVEVTLVKDALSITNGNQVKAAELLGVNRATLRKKAPPEAL